MNKYYLIPLLAIFLTSQNTLTNYARPLIKPEENVLEKLYELQILKPDSPVRLHLGYGGKHLDDYINIDFAPNMHTFQAKIGADVFADITTLNIPDNSVDEIRSCHVFEHFDRPTAIALLCKWHKSLKIGGFVHIETPDFRKSVEVFLDRKSSYNVKQQVLRHIYGSHETSWAIHCDGWYKEKFEYILKQLGFENIRFEFDYKRVTKNIRVTAYKRKMHKKNQLSIIAKKILSQSMIDRNEKKMLEIWYKNFNKIFKR